MNKAFNDVTIRNLVDEYIEKGQRFGFFNDVTAANIRKKLLEMNIDYDDSLNGDALIENNILYINRQRTFVNEDFKKMVLFHEFTHACSSLNLERKRLKKNIGYFAGFKEYYQRQNNISNTYATNDPNTYFNFAIVFLDEATAEFVATYLVSNGQMNINHYSRWYNNNQLSFDSHYDYYGVGESILNKFAQTLFLPTSKKNIKGLCSKIFEENFPKELFYQHFESQNAVDCLYKELCYFGVLAFDEEQNGYGRYEDRDHLDRDFVYSVFGLTNRILDIGREYREYIPHNIQAPDIFKR